MLTDRHLERYADVLLWGLKTSRRGRFKKGDVVLIQYDHAALKLAELLFDRIIAEGMNPVQRMGLHDRDGALLLWKGRRTPTHFSSAG